MAGDGAHRSDADRTGTMLIGRDEELAAMRAVLDAASGPVAVVLTGPGGIGKSRLLNAVAEEVARRGWTVVAGAADPLERQIPFAALVRTVGRFSASPDREV